MSWRYLPLLLMPLAHADDEAQWAFSSRGQALLSATPTVDAQVAAALLQTARAVGLLGARVTLVGVRPEVAVFTLRSADAGA
mgnify:CR=1 FL=1